jgi:hypothetical protein
MQSRNDNSGAGQMIVEQRVDGGSVFQTPHMRCAEGRKIRRQRGPRLFQRKQIGVGLGEDDDAIGRIKS